MLKQQLINLFNIDIIYNDSPEPWQIGFQDSASPTHEGITELHDSIFFYLIIICFGVLWVLGNTIITFNNNKSNISYKYANHGTLIELIWTITPALVLIAIAFPSFKLLYIMDIIDNYNFIIDNINPRIFYTIQALILPPIKYKKIKINDIKSSNITDLVIINNNISTHGYYYNKYCFKSSYFNYDIVSKIIGHLLGDGKLILSKKDVSPHFEIKQQIYNIEYCINIYFDLCYYCIRYPDINYIIFNYVIDKGIKVTSRSYPYLNELHNLFYIKDEKTNKYIKHISLDIIPYINGISLANWAINKGILKKNGLFVIEIDKYTFKDAFIIAAILHYKFNIYSEVETNINTLTPILYIQKQSVNEFIILVKPYYYKNKLHKLEMVINK